MYTIENDVPIPVDCHRGGLRGARTLYPFRSMEIGQSFTVSDAQTKRVMGAAKKFRARNPGWDYVTSRLATGGLRLWRLA